MSPPASHPPGPESAPVLEQLEQRLLLTTLLGGDVFEYYWDQTPPSKNRIALSGDIIAEFIGAFVDSAGNVILGDVPGTIIESTTGRQDQDILGGAGGADGTGLIGPTPITDPDWAYGTIGWVTDGVDEIYLQALASLDEFGNGATYGFNLAGVDVDGDTLTVIQLVQLNTGSGDGTVRAMLQAGSLSEDVMVAALSGATMASTPTGFAVDPTSGIGYAVASDVLYSVDRFSGVVTQIAVIGGGLTGVEAMAFDDAGNLYVIGFSALGEATLAQIDKVTAGLVGSATINDGSTNSTDQYLAMAFDPTDSTTVYAIATANTLNTITVGTGLITDSRTVLVDTAATLIEGLTFVKDSQDNDMLVGMDHSQTDGTTGAILPRLVSINFESGPAAASPLCVAGAVQEVYGLASYTEPGQTRPLLFGTNGTSLYRGSAVAMPLDGSGETAISVLEGADFRPRNGDADDGLLFFVARDEDADRLYKIDVSQPDRSAIQNTLTLIGTITNSPDINITSLTWSPNFELVAFRINAGVSPTASQLIDIDPATAGITAITTVYDFDQNDNVIYFTSITGIEFIDDVLDYVYAVESAGSSSMVYRIDRASGRVLALGPTSDPDDADIDDNPLPPIRGEDLQSLTWDPIIYNVFTGDFGALLATDATSDELVMIDHRARFPEVDVFAIYVVQSSEDASISIGYVPEAPAPQVMLPFDGSVGNLIVWDAQDRVLMDGVDRPALTPPDSIGRVYIGGRQRTSDGQNPRIFADLDEELGVRPAGLDDLPNDPDNDVFAGITVAASLMEYASNWTDLVDRFLRQNLDKVEAMTVARDGSIFVVDTDGVDNAGLVIRADQIAYVDAATGWASSPITIVSSGTSLPLGGTQGLDYGDVNMDGIEELYAIMEVGNDVPSVMTDLGADLLNNPQALTVTVGGVMYVIDQNAGGGFDLYQLSTYGLLGEISDIVGNQIVDLYALEADPLTGDLYAVGRVTGGDQTLYRIGTIPMDLDADLVADEVLADPVAVLDGGGVTDPFVALAFTDTAATLYTVRDVGGLGGTHTLYTIDQSTGTLTEIVGATLGTGEIRVDNDGDGVPDDTTSIMEMDFDAGGNLIAVDTGAGAGTGRLIVINVSDPALSAQLTVANSVSGSFAGYGSDRDGLFYTIDPNGAGNDQLWASAGLLPTLGSLDLGLLDPLSPFDPLFNPYVSATFTQIGPIGGGTISGVQAMAFSLSEGSVPGQQGLYVVDDNGLFYEVDPTSGALLSAGDTVEDSAGSPISIFAMDFDQTNTAYGHDRVYGRLVDIDLAGLGTGTIVVGANTMTDVGSLRPTVGDIAYDYADNEFFAVDNATGSLAMPSTDEGARDESSVLMELLGTTSGSAAGQNVDRVMLAGVLTGHVYSSGSIETLYAGWVITGYARGLFDPPASQSLYIPDNFHVEGDIRNLISKSSIGTTVGTDDVDAKDEPIYLTGFDMQVGGRVGQIWTLDTFIGAVDVEGQEDIFDLDAMTQQQSEVEHRDDTTKEHIEGTSFERFELFSLGGEFYNDTFDTPQYLGTIRDGTLGEPEVVVVDGSLNGTNHYDDLVDYYTVGLLAGQTVTVRLQATSTLYIGVIDPDNRVVATNYSDVDQVNVIDQPFRFTADKAGPYRFAVGMPGDVPFVGDPSVIYRYEVFYEITMNDVGDVTLGGLVANRDIFNIDWIPAYQVRRGDLGAIYAGADFFSESGSDVLVSTGNLRAIDAGEMGRQTGTTETDSGVTVAQFEDGISVTVSDGDAGLFRSNDVDGVLYVRLATIGGDMQLIDAEDTLQIYLYADGGLGVMRAGSMAVDSDHSIIEVNADDTGYDGIIDLIDVAGDLGTLGQGGPWIATSLGGNVRYIRVGGEVYQPSWYGGGTPSRTTLLPGQSATLRDDGGGYVHISPAAVEIDPATGAPVDTPTLSYIGYGIVGGGVALIDVTSTGGITVRADSNNNGSPVEIGRIQVESGGRGRAVTVQPDGSLLLDPDLGINLNVSIIGDDPVDVFDIVGGPAGDEYFTGIVNYTGGEIVNVTAGSIGLLAAHGSIGLATDHTGAAVNPIAVLDPDPANPFPFEQQHIGVVSGSIELVRSRQAIGNFIVDGTIGTIVANADGTVDHTDGKFEGIAGVVYATGDIQVVRIGEGIAPSGSGTFAHAGLYALGNIGSVVNQGPGSDILGNIVAEGGIGRIALGNGSIINANIHGGDLESSVEFPVEGTSGVAIGSIVLTGIGGIIGGNISAHNIGNVSVQGFGILDSAFGFSVGGDATMGNVTAGGFGVRYTFFTGGQSMGDLTATGRGNQVSALNYSQTVRYSEAHDWHPVFPTVSLNRLTDIHRFLLTSALVPMETSGIIEDVAARGAGDLGAVSSYRIQTRSLATNQLEFADSIKGIKTLDTVDGLGVGTGSLGYFKPGGDVSDLDMTVAGRINSININGDLVGGSSIYALGPNGNIRSIRVAGDMEGDIRASGTIGSVNIGGDMTGNIIVEATNPARNALGSLRLGGSLASGSLDINGNVGWIDVAETLGLAGETLHIVGNIGALRVGTSRTVAGSDLALDLDVMGNLGTLQVTGQITGDVFVGGDLSRMILNADSATVGTNILAGDVAVLGGLRSANITNGHMAGNVTVGEDIGSFRLTGGDLLAGATLASSFGDIRNVNIRNGDLLGAVRAPNGSIGSLTVTGSDMGPASAVSAESMKLLRLDGSMLAGATVDVLGELTTLRVGVNIAAGASVTAGSSRSVQVGRDLAGDVTVGYYARTTTLSVSRDLDGAVSIGGNAQLTIRRDLGGTVAVGGNLLGLTVTRTLSGDVLVDGSGNSITIGQANGAVITTGFDLRRLNVGGTMTNSLLQVGVSRGEDDQFGTGDVGETGRMGVLSSLTVRGLVSGSVVAAGGGIGQVNLAGGMTDSSVSSGLNLGGEAIAAVLADATPLAGAGERNAARSGADRQLFWGDFKSAIVGGAGMANSELTAGIDAGSDGDFGNPATNNIVSAYSLTGGQGGFGTVRAAIDGASSVLADAGISRNMITGLGTVTANVTYAVGTDLTPTNALETLVGTAVAGTPLTYTTFGGHDVTITVQGNGQVALYDEAGADTDDLIDTLVVTGTDSRSQIAIVTSTPGAVDIGRILAADDAAIGLLTFDGDLAGDGSIDPDLWLDGPVGTLAFRDMADDWVGRVGGDVNTLRIETQGSGTLRIGGAVRSMTIFDSGSNPLLNALAAAPTSDITTMTVDSAGNVWVFDAVTGNISQVNINTGVVTGGPLAVTETFDGDALVLTGMDFDGLDVLYGVAELNNQAPTVQLGNISGAAISLTALAVDSSGQIFAVENVGGVDRLVQMDPTDGSVQVVGTLADIFGNDYNSDVMALAFSDGGTLYGLVSDLDGTGGAYTPADGVALVMIDTTATSGYVRVSGPPNPSLPTVPMPGALLDANPADPGFTAITDAFTAMSVDSAGVVYAVRRVGTEDRLVTIATTRNSDLAVDVTPVGGGTGRMQIGGAGDTDVIGMGFDEDGDLIAYNNDGATAELIGLTNANLGDPTAFERITTAGILDTTVDAFAVGRIGANYTTYAYDTDDVVGGLFFVNPGTEATFGTVSTATGEFTQLLSLAEAADGTALSSAVLDLAVDIAGGGHLFVITADGRLMEYDAADGSLVAEIGTITDANTGQTLGVTAIDFDEDSGDLLGLDGRFDRLVTIDTSDATAVARTENGAVDGVDLTDLAHDPTVADPTPPTVWDTDPPVADFYTFGDAADQFFVFRGTTQDALGGITVNSVGSLTIGGGAGYSGRVVATGNTFSNVVVTGDFSGSLVTDGDITRYTQTGGDFGGSLKAGVNVGQVSISGGNFLAAGAVVAAYDLSSLRLTGSIAGLLTANSAGTIRIDGAALDGADIDIAGQARTLTIGALLAGTVSLGATSRVTVSGLLDATGYLQVEGDAGSITLAGGTDYGGYLSVGGYVSRLTVGGTHSGILDVRGGAGSVRLASLDTAIVSIGQDTGTFQVAGNTDWSVISFGTWIGPDRVYNTADDEITGGSVRSATFGGFFRDSAVVAGVLPNEDVGPDIPLNMHAYTGNPYSWADVTEIDAAEAGGVLKSYINRLTIRGNIINSWATLGLRSVAAAADGIGRTNLSVGGSVLLTRTYGDPFGAPTKIRADIVNVSEYRMYLSEEINTGNLILSQDLDDDDVITSGVDVVGTVLVTGDGEVLNDVTLDYTTYTDDGGNVRGVIIVRRAAGFTDYTLVTVTLSGSLTGDPAICDRSGLRSALRDLNQDGTEAVGEDLPGTILDGGGDGAEGGDAVYVAPFTDMPEDFADSLTEQAVPITVDGGTVTMGDELDSAADVDIFRFSASAWQFLSVNYVGAEPAMVGVFFQDDQGTGGVDDDYFEIMARYEPGDVITDAIFEAFELPETGEYFVAVTSYSYDPSADNTYTLELTLASTDDLLDGAVNGDAGLPAGEVIAYVSNSLAEHNNQLGFNDPKQLVYLDFDGGTATKFQTDNDYSQGVGQLVSVAALDLADIDVSLDGYEDDIINGNPDVVGIVENIMTIYTNTPATNPLGSLNVQRITTLGEWTVATEGLYFTTVDPAGWGLDPEADFTTVFVGNADQDIFGGGLTGIASNVDVAGQEPADNAIVFAQSFEGLSSAASTTARLNEYSRILANTAAHELGHTLGLVHQPTFILPTDLVADDPDNNILTANDANTGPALMGYPTVAEELAGLDELGTASLTWDPSEFGVGEIDTADLLLRWFS